MNRLFTFIVLTVSNICFGQTEILRNYQIADSLVQSNDFKSAYSIFKDIEPKCDKQDTLYNYILWYYTTSATQIEKAYRDNEQFDSSLYYGLESLKLIEKAKPYFDEKFASRAFFMTKNIVVSYFGLGQPDNAKKYKDILYRAYEDKKLPKGMDEYFNFSFFKWDNKNVWGYEWFEEFPKTGFQKASQKLFTMFIAQTLTELTRINCTDFTF